MIDFFGLHSTDRIWYFELLAQKEHIFGPYVRTWVKHLEGLHNYSSVSLIFCFLSVCAVCINDKWTSACIMCSKWYSVRITFRFPFQVSINVSVVRIVQYPFTYCHPFMGKLLYVSSGVLISLNTISLKVCVEPISMCFGPMLMHPAYTCSVKDLTECTILANSHTY